MSVTETGWQTLVWLGDDNGWLQTGWDAGLEEGPVEDPCEESQPLYSLLQHTNARYQVQESSSGSRPAVCTLPPGSPTCPCGSTMKQVKKGSMSSITRAPTCWIRGWWCAGPPHLPGDTAELALWFLPVAPPFPPIWSLCSGWFWLLHIVHLSLFQEGYTSFFFFFLSSRASGWNGPWT